MTQPQNATPNTGVIAIVIDGGNMKHPLVKGLPNALDGLLQSLSIKARVVVPDAVHTNEDSTVAMSRNIEHLSEGPQLDTERPQLDTERPQLDTERMGCPSEGCAACSSNGGEPTLLDIVDTVMTSSELLIELCIVDVAFKKAGVSIASRYTLPGGSDTPQHPIFTRAAWVAEAEAGDTELGYWAWADEQIDLVLEEAVNKAA